MNGGILMSDTPRQLFVGIGSAHGDDQAGWLVADRLRSHLASEKHVLIREAVIPADILDWLTDIEHLHLCDACQTGSPLATLHRWEWHLAAAVELGSVELPDTGGHPILRSSGSHDWGVAHTLRLAERLAICPSRVTIWGIEGWDFSPQHPLSAKLQEALPSIAGEILAELNREQADRPVSTQLPG